MSPNTDKLQKLFIDAVQSYTDVVYCGTSVSPQDHMQNAAKFRTYIDLFNRRESSTIDYLMLQLHSHDDYHRITAARLLIETGDSYALEPLSDLILNGSMKGLNENILFKLWKKVLPPVDTLYNFRDGQRREYSSILQAFLSYPSHKAETIVEKIIISGTPSEISAMIKVAARKADTELLKRLITIPVKYQRQIEIHRRDPQLTAAFYLCLQGYIEALKLLQETAANSTSSIRAYACYCLSLLAMPSAIPHIEKLLYECSEETISTVLDASAILGVPRLISAMVEVSQKKVVASLSGHPVSSDAIQKMWMIVGYPKNFQEEYEISDFEEYTIRFKALAVTHVLQATSLLDPYQRYDNSVSITLKRLAYDLASPHTLIKRRAAYNLQSICGEDYGFDPDDDIIANYEAILRWQERAKNPYPLSPGGWAYQGKPITPDFR